MTLGDQDGTSEPDIVWRRREWRRLEPCKAPCASTRTRTCYAVISSQAFIDWMAGAMSAAAVASRHECMLNSGPPICTIRIPVGAAAMGPIVLPQEISLHDANLRSTRLAAP